MDIFRRIPPDNAERIGPSIEDEGFYFFPPRRETK